MSTSLPYGMISSDDITDNVLRQPITRTTPDPRVQTWLDRTELELISIAQSVDVAVETFHQSFDLYGLNYKVKEYAICYYCFICSQDLWGTTQDTPTLDEIYKQKIDWYLERCNDLRPTLTSDLFMLQSSSLDSGSQVYAGWLFRG
jgi:hypothetical protein